MARQSPTAFSYPLQIITNPDICPTSTWMRGLDPAHCSEDEDIGALPVLAMFRTLSRNRLEDMGIPAVPVATSEFMTASRVQAAHLGRPGYEAVFVAHPIQDQTAEEIRARADAVADELVTRLTQA